MSSYQFSKGNRNNNYLFSQQSNQNNSPSYDEQSFDSLPELSSEANDSNIMASKSYFLYSLDRMKKNSLLEKVSQDYGNKNNLRDYQAIYQMTKAKSSSRNNLTTQQSYSQQQSISKPYSNFDTPTPSSTNADGSATKFLMNSSNSRNQSTSYNNNSASLSARSKSPAFNNNRPSVRDGSYPCYFEQLDGAYEGDVDFSYKKEGFGVFLADSGEMYIGEWADDMMHGEGILHFPFGGSIYGQFRSNKVQGVAILQLPSSQVYVAYWKESRIHGKCFELSTAQRMWTVSLYNSGTLTQRLAVEPMETSPSGIAIPKLMEQHDDIRFWMQRLAKKQYFIEKEVNQYTKHIRHVNIEKGLNYIGFVECTKIPSGLGLVSFDKRIIQGNFKNGVLEGNGRMIMDNGDVYDGGFKGGQFSGQGVYYNFENNSFVHAEFQSNKPSTIFAKGTSYPSTIIAKLKQEQHHLQRRYLKKESGFNRLAVLSDFSKQMSQGYVDCFSMKNSSSQLSFQNDKSPDKSRDNQQQQQQYFMLLNENTLAEAKLQQEKEHEQSLQQKQYLIHQSEESSPINNSNNIIKAEKVKEDDFEQHEEHQSPLQKLLSNKLNNFMPNAPRPGSAQQGNAVAATTTTTTTTINKHSPYTSPLIGAANQNTNIHNVRQSTAEDTNLMMPYIDLNYNNNNNPKEDKDNSDLTSQNKQAFLTNDKPTASFENSEENPLLSSRQFHQSNAQNNQQPTHMQVSFNPNEQHQTTKMTNSQTTNLFKQRQSEVGSPTGIRLTDSLSRKSNINKSKIFSEHEQQQRKSVNSNPSRRTTGQSSSPESPPLHSNQPQTQSSKLNSSLKSSELMKRSNAAERNENARSNLNAKSSMRISGLAGIQKQFMRNSQNLLESAGEHRNDNVTDEDSEETDNQPTPQQQMLRGIISQHVIAQKLLKQTKQNQAAAAAANSPRKPSAVLSSEIHQNPSQNIEDQALIARMEAPYSSNKQSDSDKLQEQNQQQQRTRKIFESPNQQQQTNPPKFGGASPSQTGSPKLTSSTSNQQLFRLNHLHESISLASSRLPARQNSNQLNQSSSVIGLSHTTPEKNPNLRVQVRDQYTRKNIFSPIDPEAIGASNISMSRIREQIRNSTFNENNLANSTTTKGIQNNNNNNIQQQLLSNPLQQSLNRLQNNNPMKSTSSSHQNVIPPPRIPLERNEQNSNQKSKNNNNNNNNNNSIFSALSLNSKQPRESSNYQQTNSNNNNMSFTHVNDKQAPRNHNNNSNANSSAKTIRLEPVQMNQQNKSSTRFVRPSPEQSSMEGTKRSIFHNKSVTEFSINQGGGGGNRSSSGLGNSSNFNRSVQF